MRKKRSDAIKTRLALLEAAAEVFAEEGFWKPTHEAICHRAHANTASINYHFGSKENLYVEAWKYAFEKSIRKHPPEGRALPGDPIEKRIRERILSLLNRLLDPETHDMDIAAKELTNPTGLLGEEIAKSMAPLDNAFKLQLREFLGRGASDEKVTFCYLSILNQAFSPPFRHFRPGSGKFLFPTGSFDMSGVEEVVDHIVQFVFSGINSFRDTA